MDWWIFALVLCCISESCVGYSHKRTHKNVPHFFLLLVHSLELQLSNVIDEFCFYGHRAYVWKHFSISLCVCKCYYLWISWVWHASGFYEIEFCERQTKRWHEISTQNHIEILPQILQLTASRHSPLSFIFISIIMSKYSYALFLWLQLMLASHSFRTHLNRSKKKNAKKLLFLHCRNRNDWNWALRYRKLPTKYNFLHFFLFIIITMWAKYSIATQMRAQLVNIICLLSFVCW